jgi:uncharacterized protein (TIGR04255 family)
MDKTYPDDNGLETGMLGEPSLAKFWDKKEPMTAGEKPLPEYDNPPVNEVVCGVMFKSLDTLLTPYTGLLWERYKTEYPTCQEVPPIIPMIESFEERPVRSRPEFAELPPLPRVWFVHGEGNRIIQLQRDRFLHNWRKQKAADTYPRYGQVFGMFSDHLATFQKFLQENHLGALEPVQYEMTYVNHVYKDERWASNQDVGKLFADFVWRTASKRFLPCPEGINWRTTFVLPNKQGRLHVVIQNGESREDNRPVFVFELTVRGIGTDRSFGAMKEWFDLAREWIVRGFADLTDEKTQTDLWRRSR